MVIQVLDALKLIAINAPLVNMSSVSDILDYSNKPDIKYPFVNIDLVSTIVNNYAKNYRVRLYICDRNPNEFQSYNKASIILDDILKSVSIDQQTYTANYFRLDFLDQVNGLWCEVDIEDHVVIDCASGTYFNGYVISEGGDYVVDEVEGKQIITEN